MRPTPCAGQDLSAEGWQEADYPLLASSIDELSWGAMEDSAAWEPSEFDSLAPTRTILADGGSNERLIDRIVDPTAWLMELRFRQEWNWPVGEATDSQTFQLRPTIPFRAWDHVNLLRISVPYQTEGIDGPGLGKVDVLDLVVFDEPWGRWGVGPLLQMIPGGGDAETHFLVGPAGGAVSKTKHWTFGVLIQNFLGDDESQSRIQPILAYKFDETWAVTIGQSEFQYEWNESRWTQLPVGVQVNRIVNVYGQRTQFFVNPQYNLQRESSTSGWTLFLGFALLVPDA